MKIICLLCVFLLLTGCGTVPVWETVEDFMPTIPTSTWLDESYAIQIGLPEHAKLTWQTDTCSLYEAETIEIMTETFLASDLNTAVRHLSGYEAENLLILETTRFDLPEYQFAWYTQTAEGGSLCRADLVMDGSTCYAVVCTSPEGENTMDTIRQVFSTFGLSDREMV